MATGVPLRLTRQTPVSLLPRPVLGQPALWWHAGTNDLVSGNVAAKSGAGAPTSVINRIGRAVNFTGGTQTNSYIDCGTPSQSANLGRTPTTFVAMFTCTALANIAIAERNDGNTVDAGWYLGYTSFGSSGFVLAMERSTTNYRAQSSLASLITDGVTPNVLVVTHEATVANPNSPNTRMYLNGLEQTVSVASAGAGTPGSDASQNLFIGRMQFDTAKSHTGDIVFFGAFLGTWNPALALDFSTNPWPFMAQIPLALNLDMNAPAASNVIAWILA